MNCPKCGVEVNNDEVFCYNCGERLNQELPVCDENVNNVDAPPVEVAPKRVRIPESVEKKYQQFLSGSPEQQEKTLRKLKAKDAKRKGLSKKVIIKGVIVRLIAALLIFVITSSLTVCAFAYFGSIDTPEPINGLLHAANIAKEKDESSSKKDKKDSSDKKEKPSESKDDDSSDDETDEDDPLTPENKKMIEEYQKECDEIVDLIDQEIALVGQEVVNEYGRSEIKYQTEMDAALAVARKLYDEDKIENYSNNGDNIEIFLNDGKKFVYAFPSDGFNAGAGTVTLDIATYEPCRTGDLGEATADKSAQAIVDEFPNYRFIHNYDDAKVNLDVFSKFGNNQIICWSGHGGYSYFDGPNIATGVKPDKVPNKYAKDYDDRSIFAVYSGDEEDKHWYVAVSVEFLEKVIPDDSLEGSIIFLGTCDSYKDRKLVNLLREKGAMAVLGYSDSVHTVYDKLMTETFFTRLAKEKSSGVHYSLQEAYEYAREKHGEKDHCVEYSEKTGKKIREWDTQLLISTDNPDYTLDQSPDPSSERNIVLVLDVSGSMQGDPIDETAQAAKKFVNTVKDSEKDVGIALITFSTEADVICNFSKNYDYLLDCIDSINAYGNTNFVDALSKAEKLMSVLESEKNSIVFFTDGEPNTGGDEDDILEISDRIKANPEQHIYTLGFFNNVIDPTSAKALLDEMASEGCHYEVTDAEQIKYFFEDIASEISGSTQYINIIIACPVNVKVKYKGETLSSKGVSESARTSFGSITFQGNYEEGKSDRRTKILRLKADNKYDISIDGNGSGTMDYTIQFMDENGDYSDVREFNNITINRATQIKTVAEKADESVLEVDEDGDGKVDYKYIAKENGKGRIRDYTTFKNILIYCLIFTVVLLLAIDVLRLIKSRNRRILIELIESSSPVS